jgi:hypothetical protein
LTKCSYEKAVVGRHGEQNMSTLQVQLEELRERVARLEQQRTRRGVTNQRGAAEYLGRSAEWLRQQERGGAGPERNPDGSYSYDRLDEYLHTRKSA